MGRIVEAVVFTLFSGSLFAIGFSRGLTNVRNNEASPSEKKPSQRFHPQTTSPIMESGEGLALRALKKATVYSVVGCSMLGFLGYLLFKSLGIQPKRSKGSQEGSINELDELRALIIKRDE